MRRFWVVSAVTFAICAALAQAPDAQEPRRQQKRASAASVEQTEGGSDPIPFIDSHVHLNDEAMQIELMRRFGATRAVVFWGRASDNGTIAEAARRHPGLFIPFASISPERSLFRSAWNADDPTLLARLDELLESGLYKGIGEISAVHFPSPGLNETDFDPLGPMMRGVLELARKHRVPVLVHVELTRMRELSGLLEAFPDVPVIWAHGGYTPLFLARRMLERHPNLTYELSARTWPRHPRAPDYTILKDGRSVWPEWLTLIEAMPGRFIVGTDASHRSLAGEVMKFESVQNLLSQLSPATRERVARGNLIDLVEGRR